jgi:hypothetical protein
MSHRASAVVLLVLSFALVLLGIAAGNVASDEAEVRAGQLARSVSAPDARDRADFARYAESTLDRQVSAERDRNWLLGGAAAGVAGAFVVLLTARRRRAEQPSARVGSGQRAFYVLLIVLGLGSAAVIYTVLFDELSETQLVAISPYWIFPSVFGYYGLVAQRMQAKLQTTHLDTVSDQLLNVIKETGFLGQIFALLIHAPFLLVKSRVPWVTALVGSLCWAIALSLFFNVVFPRL